MVPQHFCAICQVARWQWQKIDYVICFVSGGTKIDQLQNIFLIIWNNKKIGLINFMVLGYYENRRWIFHCRHLTKMSAEWNVAGVFPLDQPTRRWEDVSDNNKCLICQDTPGKGLLNIKLASAPKLIHWVISEWSRERHCWQEWAKLSDAICCRQDPVCTKFKYL